jgi:type I restriction enzyme S subunit
MAFVPQANRYLHNQRIGKVTATSDDVCLAFLYHAFKTRAVREQLSNTASGSKVRHTSPERIYDVSVPLPSVDEQQRIATILSTIDARIDLNNRINAELEALAKTIYDYWFVQFDFPDANDHPYKSSGGAMVWNDALKREIPAGWDAGSLDDLGKIVGGSTPSTADAANFAQGVNPWITPKDLSNNKGNKFIARGETDVSEAGMRSASLRLYPAGTVLMSSRAPVGYLAIALNPVTTNQGFKSFVPSKGYGTSFVYYAVERSLPTIIQYASGSTFVEISGSVLKSIHAVLPDKSVTNAFCSLVEPTVQRQQQAEVENRELTQLRDWLLPLLMNGQVRVADSAP